MVSKSQASLYLFVGGDQPSKDKKLKQITAKLLLSGTSDFDSDLLYGKELTLKGFQERTLLFPLKAQKRVIIVRQAELLKPKIKEFISENIKDLASRVVLILDLEDSYARDSFFIRVSRSAEVFRFTLSPDPDTFALSRQIGLGRADSALRILRQLLKKGERPERIMGGLRYSWEKHSSSLGQIRRKLSLLLSCDLEIKRGRLSCDLALEKLIISLCALRDAPRKA